MLVKEYAKLIGVSESYVTRQLRKNISPKAIKTYRKFGNTYDLVVDLDQLQKEIALKSKK